METQLLGEAIILKRQTFKESDLLVYLYTKESGLIKVVARGAKKFNSKLAAHLEPISIVNYLCLTNNSPYKLVSVNNLNYFTDIRENLIKQNTLGLVFNYLVRIIKENEQDLELYLHLKNWLIFLNHVKIDKSSQADAYLLSFLVKFLQILGFAIEIKDCCLGSKIKQFDFQAGSFVCQKCQTENEANNTIIISEAAFNLLRKLIKGDKKISFSETNVKQSKKLLLQFLEYTHNL